MDYKIIGTDKYHAFTAAITQAGLAGYKIDSIISYTVFRDFYTYNIIMSKPLQKDIDVLA